MSMPYTAGALNCETRVDTNGMLVRTYVEPDGFRFQTIEVPVSMLGTLGERASAIAAARSLRGIEARRRANALKAMVKTRAEAGWKNTAIGHELGITDSRVSQIRKELGL